MMSQSQDTSPVIPRTRTLVLCFDGTTNQYDGDNTNVVNFFALLKNNSSKEQVCYYQAGIGTFFAPGVVSPMLQWIAKIADAAVAWYLDAHVMDGYKFVCQNYRPGDKICIFGFSRGAYTARALAGMIYKVGLLSPDNPEQINFAYKLYTRTDKEGNNLAQGFKQTFSQDVTIEFVGVWDTVASVGVISGKALPFTDSNTSIRTFRQALSLDEHRAKFRPNQFHRIAPNPAAAQCDPEHASLGVPRAESSSSALSSESEDPLASPSKKGLFRRPSFKKEKRAVKETQHIVGDDSADDEYPVKEVWFAGCHCDVGGGAVLNSDAGSLANITLRWMVQEVMQSQCGILFDNDALLRLNIPTAVPRYFHHKSGISRTVESEMENETHAELGRQPGLGIDDGNNSSPMNTGEQSVTQQVKFDAGKTSGDAVDALQPIHDDLSIKQTWQALFWWILEIIPMSYYWQDVKGVWHRTFSCHLGQGRHVQDVRPLFHMTVKERMKDPQLKYTPKAKWIKGNERYTN